MATKKKTVPKIIQVTTTRDGRIASLLYDNGRVFVRVYPTTSYDNAAAKSRWKNFDIPRQRSKKQ
jgi:hypothetical protein